MPLGLAALLLASFLPAVLGEPVATRSLRQRNLAASPSFEEDRRPLAPAHYSWRTFYDHIIDLTQYSFSTRAIFRRFLATQGVTARWLNLVRAVSTEGFGRARYHREIRHRLDTDPQFQPYFEQESSVLPEFYRNMVRQDLGPLMEWLPEDALYHDPNAYLQSEQSKDVIALV